MNTPEQNEPHALRNKPASPRPVLTVFALLLVVLSWGIAEIYVRHARQTDIQRVTRESANLARAIDEHTTRTINAIDQIALLLKREVETRGRKLDLSRFSRELQINPDLVLLLAVIDDQGDAVAASAPFGSVNVRDRDHFQAHVGHDSGRLYVGRPILGRITKKWNIPMSRRINKPDGSYGGTVYISVDPTYFSNLYRNLDLGTYGVVTLFGLDGYVRSRLSGLDADVGQDVRKAPIFSVLATSPHGSIAFSSVIDGIRRIYSYRTLKTYPLAIAVGVAEIEALAGVLVRERYAYGSATAVTVLVLAFSVWLHLLYRREERAEEAVRLLNHDLARRASELEAFGYSIAHDLRAPLRAVGGFSAILQTEHASRLDSEGLRLLQRISDAANRMSDLIDGLLTLTRLSATAIHWQRVDLSALARELSVEFQNRNPARRIQWFIADGAVAHGDPDLLRVVLSGLLHNAWKFTGKLDEAQIEFGFRSDPGADTVFYVRDNGAGFDMAFAGKLFGIFQRLHDVREFPGEGIGLATVKRIMDRLGGRAWGEGTPGRGATFYFSLPARA